MAEVSIHVETRAVWSRPGMVKCWPQVDLRAVRNNAGRPGSSLHVHVSVTTLMQQGTKDMARMVVSYLYRCSSHALKIPKAFKHVCPDCGQGVVAHVPGDRWGSVSHEALDLSINLGNCEARISE